MPCIYHNTQYMIVHVYTYRGVDEWVPTCTMYVWGPTYVYMYMYNVCTMYIQGVLMKGFLCVGSHKL